MQPHGRGKRYGSMPGIPRRGETETPVIWTQGRTGETTVTEQRTEDTLALEAVTPIQNGMTVGLGAGRASARGIRALAERVRTEGLNIRCCAASESGELLARELALNVVDFANIEELDYLLDGADEVTRDLSVMKGSRGAITRERMLAWAARHTCYMVGAEKVSERLGEHATLVVAVMAFGLASTRAAMRNIGLHGVCRRDMDGKLFITDNANLILDVTLTPDDDPEQVAAELNAIPGVVDHGLFLHEADVILIEHGDGRIERIEREDTPAE